ncbi:SH3 domain-containing protein [Neolewinella lacunae]|uniref:SH3 domain-containing protein n=2 Tax=Neolewinella lacunae TaxID=1517758 RepID=A0A923PI20_9BACT|nr:SH3 domain-containing protein [Neolewinella lacunae]MBC6993674.1 SH3 domain-containing protein [Neolewinella lacunae]MDN3636369.1 SH3 domain-containing protein [Neolewinella lacunae]
MKKYLILIALTVFTAGEGFAINSYFKGDTLMVWAEGGLSIRDTNSLSGQRMGVIPYGGKVIVKSTKLFRIHEEEIKLTSAFQGEDEPDYVEVSLSGKWVKVMYGDLEGYVFDGYLSKYAAPRILENRYSEGLHDYLSREFGLLSHKEASDGDYFFRETYYGGGVSLLNSGEKSAYIRIILPGFSMEEIVLFLKNSDLAREHGGLRLYKNRFVEEEQFRTLGFMFTHGVDVQITITILREMVIFETSSAC